MVSPRSGCAKSARHKQTSQDAFIRNPYQGKSPAAGLRTELRGLAVLRKNYFFVFLYSKLSLPWSESMLACAWAAHFPLGASFR